MKVLAPLLFCVFMYPNEIHFELLHNGHYDYMTIGQTEH